MYAWPLRMSVVADLTEVCLAIKNQCSLLMRSELADLTEVCLAIKHQCSLLMRSELADLTEVCLAFKSEYTSGPNGGMPILNGQAHLR